MKAVLFTHPEFLRSTSMPLVAGQIRQGLEASGFEVTVLSPKRYFYQVPCPPRLKKWLGYLDQFVIFPIMSHLATKGLPDDTIYIFSDQALGPWIPAFSKRPHAIHCMDFLALRSAAGEFPQNPISWTGRIYQRWIRSGFSSARNFICISHKTGQDLERFLAHPEQATIHVVHLGLNYPYAPMPADTAIALLTPFLGTDTSQGFLLHVGGNQWYKNRVGVVAIYAEYVRRISHPLPLLLMGAEPTSELREAARQVPSAGKVEFVVSPPVEAIHAAYSVASALLFPSIAEGFGWPILEAMACGCSVLTTNDAPMTEVGGEAATYLPVLEPNRSAAWATESADILMSVLARTSAQREQVRIKGLAHAACFNGDSVTRRYVEIYRSILQKNGT